MNTKEEILQQCTLDDKIVRLPDEQLDRQLYLQVKKALEAIGGKWKGGKTNGFVFESDPAEHLEVIATGQELNLKKKYQFFETPDNVAFDMVEIATALRKPEPGLRIIEPSAGRGWLIVTIQSKYCYGETQEVDCFEIQESCRKHLEGMDRVRVLGSDFLQCNIRNAYDVIIANPPFTRNQDIDHVRKMYDVLAPGGVMVTLTSPSWSFGSQKKQVEFREWLDQVNATVADLEPGAFKDSGTMIACKRITIIKSLVGHPGDVIQSTEHSEGQKIQTPIIKLPAKPLYQDKMKFIINRTVLQTAASLAKSCIPSNTQTLPILGNFLFDINDGVLAITATDLHISIKTEISVESEENGRIAVPAGILLDTLKMLPEQPVSFLVDRKTHVVELRAGDGLYKFTGEDGNDFPKIAMPTQEASVHMPASVLTGAINKTLVAVSNDELRPAMCGVYTKLSNKDVTFAATNAHILVKYIRIGEQLRMNNGSFIIPKKALQLLKSALPKEDIDVKLEYDNKNAFFSFGQVKVICRLIDEKFPDYEAIIPHANTNTLTIDRIMLLNALQRVAIYANVGTSQVVLKIEGSELRINAEDLDFSHEAEERLHCNYDGDDITIGFNAKLFIELLKALTSEEVVLSMSTPNRAALIYPPGYTENDEAESILMLLMPMILNSYK